MKARLNQAYVLSFLLYTQLLKSLCVHDLQSTADQLNFVNIPLPFKSAEWIHRRATTKPAKRTLKQLLVAERERAGGARLATTAAGGAGQSLGPSEKNSRRGTPVLSGRSSKPSRGKNARFLSKAVKEELAREAAEAAAVAEDEDVKPSENGDDGEMEDPLLVRDEDGNVRKREIITCRLSLCLVCIGRPDVVL
jgi:hypothetical protein